MIPLAPWWVHRSIEYEIIEITKIKAMSKLATKNKPSFYAELL